MSEKVKFALVGCGRIGKSHVRIIQSNPDTELMAICDVKNREDLDPEYPDLPYYNTLEALLEAHPDLDAITIATPNGLHARQAIQILEKGINVVIEKPIALRKEEAEKVIYTALQHHSKVFGVMQNRYSPPSVWIKKMVEGGRLGEIYMVQVNCYWNRDDRYYTGNTWHGSKDMDGGTLFTQFSHFIDIMYWLCGDITNIIARLRDFNHKDLTDFEDSGIVSFDFVNGGMGVINYSTSCWNKNFESSITILAEKGTVKIGGQYMDKVEYCHVEGYEMEELDEANPPNEYEGYKGSAANHIHLIQNVVDVLKGNGRITTNALEGMKVVDIIQRIYDSADG